MTAAVLLFGLAAGYLLGRRRRASERLTDAEAAALDRAIREADR